MVAAAAVGAVAVVSVVWLGRDQGLPRIESRQLGAVRYTSTCRNTLCEIELEARTVSGDPISIPKASTLTYGCGSSYPRFSVYDDDPTNGTELGTTCRFPTLLAAWPTVMGLPPVRFTLPAVKVANRSPIQ
jgi:hypothetical protein